MYKLLSGGPDTQSANAILRLTDGVLIPIDERNIDYREYLSWLAQGNTPLPADEQ